MIHRNLSRILILAVILTTSAVVMAGSLHFVGSTKWALGSLTVSGSVVGLASSGVPQGAVRYVGYGYCYTPQGAYWTPKDPDQMNNDPDKTDDYPEVTIGLPSGSNRADFTIELPNPGDPGSNVPEGTCAANTWVWAGATLQLWSNVGTKDNPVLFSLLAQKDFVCYPKKNGTFDCR